MKTRLLPVSLILLTPIILLSCFPRETIDSSASTTTTMGTISLVANGEDFLRQGFVSKDGWNLTFNHFYVTVNEVIAYENEIAFDVKKELNLKKMSALVLLSQAKTLDLANSKSAIEVNKVEAAAGNYNVLAWQVLEATEGVSKNYTMVLEGTGKKEEKIVNFVLSFHQPLRYLCGEYIGEERKGILTANGHTELEITFHLDHLFGNQNVPGDDTVNKEALGFYPMAVLAKNNLLNLNQIQLKNQLKPQDYQKLYTAILSLGHVGEGHCLELGNKS